MAKITKVPEGVSGRRRSKQEPEAPPLSLEQAKELVQGVSEEPLKKPGFLLEAIELESAELFSVGTIKVEEQPLLDLPYEGSYVQVKTDVGTTDDDIDLTREFLFSRGAKAVRVQPRPRAEVVLQAIKRQGPRETIRDACKALVESSASADKVALLAEVERSLSKSGA